MIELVLEGL